MINNEYVLAVIAAITAFIHNVVKRIMKVTCEVDVAKTRCGHRSCDDISCLCRVHEHGERNVQISIYL